MQEDIRTLLLNSCPRVSWGARVRGSALPALVLHLIDSPTDYTMDGACTLTRARVQVDCWAASYAAAVSLSRDVISAASGFRGTVGGTVFSGMFVDAIHELEDDNAGAEELLFRVSVDFQVWGKPI